MKIISIRLLSHSTIYITTISSRVRRCRLIPLTEPYVRASYTAHAHFHSVYSLNTYPVATCPRSTKPCSKNHCLVIA
ncbi:hypothetical protein CTM91_19350 [Photobacterium aquimaris]|nr:hypothetical protein CTM91_19350 [Photobacterium aquimaris]